MAMMAKPGWCQETRFHQILADEFQEPKFFSYGPLFSRYIRNQFSKGQALELELALDTTITFRLKLES